MISKNIQLAKKVLESDGIIGFPTETVYGLAGNIYSDVAIQKIYSTKKRPSFNPLIVHIKGIEDLEKIAKEIPEKAKILAKEFWPGPLTMILKKQPTISDIISAGKETVAVRIPNHPIALELLKSIDFPLAAPSANPFGSISPTSALHVDGYFGDELEIILDGGVCQAGLESTIVGFNGNDIIIYRLGAISVEDIEAVVGKVFTLNNNDDSPDAPGMLSKHYAPNTSLIFSADIEKEIKENQGKKIGLLLFDKPIENKNIKYQFILSSSSCLKEAASKLYETLHELDKLGLDVIIAKRFPDIELGRTINDKLERASKK